MTVIDKLKKFFSTRYYYSDARWDTPNGPVFITDEDCIAWVTAHVHGKNRRNPAYLVKASLFAFDQLYRERVNGERPVKKTFEY